MGVDINKYAVIRREIKKMINFNDELQTAIYLYNEKNLPG
jgi:hypothetical protein